MDIECLLGDFLRARRATTLPSQAGLPVSGSRRTPGLRREEVAMLAGVSTDYYVRLEQGRERSPSDQVLRSLARVFRLGDEATDYLYRIAGPERPVDMAAVSGEVSPRLMQIMRSFRHAPAYLMNHRLDLLAFNSLSQRFYGSLVRYNNCIRAITLSAEAREFFTDWEQAIRDKTARLRAGVAMARHDPRLHELVDELTEASEDFRRVWARHEVLPGPGTEMRRVRHPQVGELSFTNLMVTVGGAPGQYLGVVLAGPDSASERALADLAEDSSAVDS
ncbi:helix-turn-helix domain-containing protein [Microbispora sp. RL4-1S]|uniref:Helix-turn-helix domain-containing protein n=1 Tax=Microbispora oryzae TaxID=2806554 RepID=A0A940WJH9_9ACTN|nr:helix-turn-helix transcriptional regulator [Microbispora oryzae]MBP2706864.1 helix-turn-helix domain-containing protein [Microbispora oryzae]